MEENALRKSELSDLIAELIEMDAADDEGLMVAEFFPAATDEQIVRFEQKNKFVLPELVKEWLRFSDGGSLFNGSVQLCGIVHMPYMKINPDDVLGFDDMKEDYVRIGGGGFGETICAFNNSQKILFGGGDGEDIAEYTNFKEFLEQLIKKEKKRIN